MTTPRPDFDPYKTLQVDPEADQEVIQAAFRRLAQKYHPDLTARPEAAARMIALNRAWEMIGSPARRAAYDRERAVATTTHAHPPHADAAAAPRGHARHSGHARPPTDSTADRSRGAAGPPPGRPSGSVLNFGRYAGWSLGEIARTDLEYVEWLDRTPIGRTYREEIDTILRRTGRRRSADAEAGERHGLYRRR